MRSIKSLVKRKGRKLIGKAAVADEKIMKSFADKMRFVPYDDELLLKQNLAQLDKENFMILCKAYRKTVSEKIYVSARSLAKTLSRPLRKRI